MKIVLHKNFVRGFKKLRPHERERFRERRNLFIENPHNPILNDHELKGKYKGCRSINITGDLRLLYKLVRKNMALFIVIDTHSNLYS